VRGGGDAFDQARDFDREGRKHSQTFLSRVSARSRRRRRSRMAACPSVVLTCFRIMLRATKSAHGVLLLRSPGGGPLMFSFFPWRYSRLPRLKAIPVRLKSESHHIRPNFLTD